MADKTEMIITPRDPEFGLPLPIAPVPGMAIDNAVDALNDHHAWHPKNDERLMQPPQNPWTPSQADVDTMNPTARVPTSGGWALRNSRLQRVNRRLHNYRELAYHQFYSGPELPVDEDEQFRLVVLACAGLVPRQGIDLSTGQPQVITMSDEQMTLLQEPLNAQAFGYRNFRFIHEPVQRFLRNYILRRELGHVSQILIEEFLDRNTSNERRAYLGHLLLAKQIEVATNILDPQFQTAQNAGLLDPRIRTNPRGFIKKRLIGSRSRQEGDLFPKLAALLRVNVRAA